MSNLVIVALPSKDDYVNKISSEKVAHMTLLFLGDDASKVKNLSLILDFVKHASETSLMRFGMEVDHRGELGPDLADVLFFSKNKWSGFETVRDYRSYLLKNDNIRAAYDAAQQHPEWNPHLTLGYPDTPANPDERDYPGINYVDFDRIAVWFGDYEGIEFSLKKYDWNLDVVMDSVVDGEVFVDDILDELFVEDLLSHHGILGMKWGRRKSQTSADQTVRDAKWYKKTHTANMITSYQGKTVRRIGNEAWKASKPEVRALKKSPEFSSREAKRQIRKNKGNYFPQGSTTKDTIAVKYQHEVSKIWMKHIREVAPKHLQTSPSGKFQDKLVIGKDYWDVNVVEVKHANISNTGMDLRVRLIFDEEGYIEDIVPMEDSMTQTTDLIEDILSHHGILGMKWGHRSSRSVGSSRSERRAAKKVAKQDKIFSKKSTSLNTKIAMNNAVAGAMEHKQLPRINNKAVYKKASADGTLNNPNSPITKQYHKEIQSAYVREINNFASGFTNASGTQKVVAKESDSDALGFKLTIVNVKHDDSSIMVVKYIKNSKGEIIGFKVEDDSLTQTSLIVEDILSHHGVLGMKWGRRSSSSGPQSVSVRDRGKKFKATGGAGHPGHKDAVAPRVSGRIAKKSGVKALSNQQLEEYNKRLNLEQNYKRLSYNDKNAGQKFVARLLGKTGQTQAEAAANQVAAHQVKKLMVKTAIVGA